MPKREIFGYGTEEELKGTSGNPRSRENDFVPSDQAPDWDSDNPETALMRKRGELDEEGFELPSMASTEPAEDNTEEEDDELSETDETGGGVVSQHTIGKGGKEKKSNAA
ncbi:MAG: hypothetical protein PHD72_02650 [Patescibacteria group bacterium]|nr:hypothetical protein [Patescibacteria group bacterium]